MRMDSHRRHKRHLALVLALLVVQGVQACEISDLRLETKVGPTSLVIAWKALGCPKDQVFQINANHLRFKACLEEKYFTDKRLDLVNQTAANWAEVAGLQPFSEYNLEVSTGSDKKVIAITTAPWQPNVRARHKPGGAGQTPQKQAIVFGWLGPDLSGGKCKDLHGVEDGYRVELFGEDKWVRSKQPVATATNLPTPTFYVSSLKPHTKYRLKVYVQNEGRLWDENLPLDILAQTLPSQPLPPTSFALTPLSSASINLRWVPSYPPTGPIEKYVVKQGVPGEGGVPQWTNEIEVDPSQNVCHKSTSRHAFKDPFCFVVNDLEPEKTYVFKVKTVNANVTEPSDYSVLRHATTEPERPPEPEIPPVSTIPPPQLPDHPEDTTIPPFEPEKEPEPVKDPEHENKTEPVHPWSIVLAIAIVLLLLLVLGMCYVMREKFRFVTEEVVRIRKGRTPFTNQNSVISGDGNGNGHESSTSFNFPAMYYANRNANQAYPQEVGYVERKAIDHINGIQRRRLPEPPPVGRLSNDQFVRDSAASGEYTEPMASNKTGLPHAHPPAPLSPNNRDSNMSDSEFELSSEYADHSNYLKPTFVRQSSNQPEVGGDVAAAGRGWATQIHHSPENN